MTELGTNFLDLKIGRSSTIALRKPKGMERGGVGGIYRQLGWIKLRVRGVKWSVD